MNALQLGEGLESARFSAGHVITIEERRRMVLSGVSDVESFNESEVCVVTEFGRLSVMGQGLHIIKLNLDEGQVIVEGLLEAMEYDDPAPKSRGLFGRKR